MNERGQPTSRHAALAGAIVVALALGGALYARAQESFGTPSGPLSRAHQGKKCATCHNPDGDLPADKCLACHKPIAKQQQARQGLHGSAKLSGRPCVACHTEHKGPRGDLGGWRGLGGVAAFDHQLTGFPLTGKHGGRPCRDCHDRQNAAGEPRFPDNSRSCAPCHSDTHSPTLGPKCRNCHSGERWRVASFDHDQQTQYPLVGKHKELAEQKRCASCHPIMPARFKPAPTSCGDAACHKYNDRHLGENGAACGDCHSPTGWRPARGAGVGHEVAPQRFGGAHDRVPCGRCHTGERKLRGMASSCITCHRQDDIHHNALGPRCGDCHTQQSFLAARFNHAQAGCMLRGVHRVLPCVDCHKGGNYAGLSPMCVSCHRDDAMRAAGVIVTNPANPVLPELHVLQTACTNCHNTNSFRLGAGTRQSPPESVCQ